MKDGKIEILKDYGVFILLHNKLNKMKKVDLDDIQTKLIAFFKNNVNEEWLTLREIAQEVWVKHPQTILNKLNQLVLKWLFSKDGKGFKLIRDSIEKDRNTIVQLPIYGFAQCWNQWKAVVEEYTNDYMPVTLSFIGTADAENCFFVRAKWNSMEPKIQDGDLVLIRQQEVYEPSDFVFVVHNSLPKLKKIIESEWILMLESTNRFFESLEISPFDETKVIWVVKKVIKDL